MNRRILGALGAAMTVAVVAGPPPGFAASPPDLQVVESTGIAAVQGVITRVPAESPGGAVYSETTVNLDKARGTAAGFTAGNLVEIFFGTSSKDYRNPTLVRSQYPPTSAVPADASAETGNNGPAGATTVAATKSTEQPSATATATAESLPGNVVAVTAGRSGSWSAVDPDGTVSTQTQAGAAAVVIGGVVRFTDFSSVATARVDGAGQPLAETDSTVGGIFVNGVPARLSDEGLELADQRLLSASQVAGFNAGLAQLQAKGITIAGVRAEVAQGPGRARAAAAVAVVRYQVPAGPIPNSIGNDEEFLLGQVVAESIAARRSPAEPLPALAEPLPAASGDGAGPSGAGGSAAPAPRAARVDPPALTPGGSASPPRREDSAGDSRSAEPIAASAPAESASPATALSNPDTPDEFALADAGRITPATRLRRGYSIFILAALGGAALLIARQRTRLV